MKKIMGIILTVVIFFTANIYAQAANGDIKILVDGQELVMDVKPLIVESRTLVPVRAVVERLGGKVNWDGEKRTVTITKNDTLILLTLNEKTATVNGTAVTLDLPAQMVNSRVMIPLRFVAEALGVKVDFYKNTVIILTDIDADISVSKAIIDGIPIVKDAAGASGTGGEAEEIEQVVSGRFIVTSPVSRNEMATVVFKGEPNSEYSIYVYYQSGASTAEGLEKKMSDASGTVSWSWKIGGKTNPGTYEIMVRGNSDSYKTTFIVE